MASYAVAQFDFDARILHGLQQSARRLQFKAASIAMRRQDWDMFHVMQQSRYEYGREAWRLLNPIKPTERTD